MKDNAVAEIDSSDEWRGLGMSELVISVLGAPRVEIDGTPVQVDTRKATALLIYLAISGRTQSRDRLTGLLWPEYDTERARAALRRTLSALKKALGGDWVSADRLGVSLDPAGTRLDLAEFQALLARADSHGHPEGDTCSECVRDLSAAVGLVGGEFLQGFGLRDAEPFEEWQSLEAEDVERRFAGALDRLVKAHVAEGDLEAAVAVAERKLALDPLDEPAHRQLMQLYAWRGMRTAALQQYRECVAVLDRELGVSPLAETTALYQAIGEGAVATLESTTLLEPSIAEQVPAATPATHALQGRDAEWQRLLNAHSQVKGGGRLVVVSGEAGIGKTRLGRDVVDALAQQGAATVVARVHEAEAALPYALVTQVLEAISTRIAAAKVDRLALAEAARLVPALLPEGRPPASVEDPGALTRLYEGIRRVLVSALAGDTPGVLFLDDLHWCDTSSREVLGYILRRLADTPLLIVASWRSEEIDQDHPLRRLEIDASSRGDSISLPRLRKDDVHALVAESVTASENEVSELSVRLMQETEGIPFFVVEYLTVLATGSGDWQMPATIKQLLRSRAGLVGQTARQVMGAAAVIDRSFDFDTVWRASGRTELEAVDALDELVRHGLVISSEEGATYEFAHEKLREFVYSSMSPARRRVLHRRVAEAFIAAGRREERASSLVALIARHLELGGQEAEAARYHEAAAQSARAVFANSEALAHYLAALALGHSDPASLHEGAGDMLVLLGDYRRAVDSFEKAASLASPEAIPVLERKLGEVHLRRGDYDLSQSHFVVALETLQGQDRVNEARLLAGMSFNARRKGQLEEATALAERALEAATASGDERALAQALNQRGILENARGDHDAATVHLRRSLALAEELGDGPGRVAALNNLALAARSRHDLEGASELTQRALEICAEYGDRHREAALRNNLADLLHELGDEDGAMTQLKKATATLAEIGEEPTGLLPEVWKLVEW